MECPGAIGPMIRAASDWNDLLCACPRDPGELIAYASITGPMTTTVVGEYVDSETYLPKEEATVISSPFKIQGVPLCVALGTDDARKSADAEQWNFGHLTSNVVSTTPRALWKLMYLRAGEEWRMLIPINLYSTHYPDLQLSMRDNAATRGDCAGKVPVVSFTGDFTGLVELGVTLKSRGRYMMGLRAIDDSDRYSMFEMEWVVVM